jgi:hypothetical protein
MLHHETKEEFNNRENNSANGTRWRKKFKITYDSFPGKISSARRKSGITKKETMRGKISVLRKHLQKLNSGDLTYNGLYVIKSNNWNILLEYIHSEKANQLFGEQFLTLFHDFFSVNRFRKHLLKKRVEVYQGYDYKSCGHIACEVFDKLSKEVVEVDGHINNNKHKNNAECVSACNDAEDIRIRKRFFEVYLTMLMARKRF